MRWIGLTGGIATGKSTVSNWLKAHGYAVIDADELARLVVAPGSEGLRQIVSHFGAEILDDDGNLDRRKLGALVFADREKLADLEGMIHPLVQAQVQSLRDRYEREGREFVFYDVPLLYEKKLQDQFDHIIVVAADEEIQKSRMRARDALSENEIEARLRSQLPMAEKIKVAHSIVENNGSREELERRLTQLVKQLRN